MVNSKTKEAVRDFIEWDYQTSNTVNTGSSNYWQPIWPWPEYVQPSYTYPVQTWATTTLDNGKKAIRIAKKMLDEGAVDIETPQEMLALIELIMEEL